MKIKKTRIFFLVHEICHCRVIALFIFSHYKPLEACEQNITRTALAKVMIFVSQIVSKV